ncbi:MAG: DUF1272 domain-containing protein [Hyphomonas sp.]
MLDMRPNCEQCDTDLPADEVGAFICSFECTFCSDCTNGPLEGRCPNCGGDTSSPGRCGAASRSMPIRPARSGF